MTIAYATFVATLDLQQYRAIIADLDAGVAPLNLLACVKCSAVCYGDGDEAPTQCACCKAFRLRRRRGGSPRANFALDCGDHRGTLLRLAINSVSAAA